MLTVAEPTLTTLLSLPVSSLAYGQPLTLTATVVVAPPNTGTPSGGMVTFKDGTATLGTSTLDAGTATLQVSTLSLGLHVLTASYGGNGANFAASATTVGPNSIITTFAGGGSAGDGGAATAAALYDPAGVALDAAGDLFIADQDNNRIRELNHATGVMTTIAGNGTSGYSGDGGQASAAELSGPKGVAVDTAGDLFIADSGNSVIREVNHSTGVTTTVAGNGTSGGSSGQATAAQLSDPYGVAVDGSGNLFIADTNNQRILEVNLSSGAFATVAGNGTYGYGGDQGQATAAELAEPYGIAVDASRHLFIADSGNSAIREVNLTSGVITTVAGNGTYGDSGDNGPATAAELSYPQGVAVDAAGDLFVADVVNNSIREVNHANGVIATVAGNGSPGYSGDGGQATAAELSGPAGVTVNAGGDLFIADTGNNVIREVNLPGGVISTAAGNGTSNYIGEAGPATAAGLASPAGVAVDAAGDLFIADPGNNRIREVNASNGLITTVAGDGTSGYSGDGGQATAAELSGPEGVAVDAAGNLFIADSGNTVIREVNLSTGVISTVAGNGSPGYSGDGGQATAAELDSPSGVAVDAAGDLFIADTVNDVIREVNQANGVITTVAGDGSYGYSGDNGQATAAELASPYGVTWDASGDLFIADAGNSRVRQVNLSSGVISTVAGNGSPGYSGDGAPATAAELDSPYGVVVDGSGDLFIADYGNSTIREVSLASGLITTAAGNGSPSYSGDGGPATAAELNSPSGVAVDSSGDLFIADTHSNRVREVLPGIGVTILPAAPFLITGPTAGTFSAGQSVTIQWTAGSVDVSGPTKITLGYDTDATPFDANQHWIEVDRVTAANGGGQYSWNTAGVASGTYYLSGYMYDFSTSQAVYAYLGTSIVITGGSPPAFTLSGPTSGTFTAGVSVTIQWTAANVDVSGATTISLGYDVDATPFDANQHWIEVDRVTAANGGGQYSWNTTGVASGTYYLSGYMYDFSTSQAVYSHLGTSIAITRGTPPAFTLSGPSSGTFTAGVSVSIQWTAANVDLSGPTKITLGYDPDTTPFDANQHWIEVDQGTATDGVGGYSWNTAGVASGTYYLSGYMYDFSTSQAVYSHLGTSFVITGGSPPAFTLHGLTSGTFSAGQSVTIQWTAANVDLSGPTKITLGYDADVTPFDANQHWIEVDQGAATDGVGGYIWNTTGVASGTYYLNGYMYDFSTSQAVYSHLAASIVITGGNAPAFAIIGPNSGTFTAGASVTIQWTATNVDLSGPTKITLGYDADSTPFDANQQWIEIDGGTADNGGGDYTWNTASVSPGTYFLSGYMYDFSTDQAIYSSVATSIVVTSSLA